MHRHVAEAVDLGEIVDFNELFVHDGSLRSAVPGRLPGIGVLLVELGFLLKLAVITGSPSFRSPACTAV